jgi:hypothetical protein
LTYGVPYSIIKPSKGGKEMSKKKKKSQITATDVAKLLAGMGTLLMGIAAVIQALR